MIWTVWGYAVTGLVALSAGMMIGATHAPAQQTHDTKVLVQRICQENNKDMCDWIEDYTAMQYRCKNYNCEVSRRESEL